MGTRAQKKMTKIVRILQGGCDINESEICSSAPECPAAPGFDCHLGPFVKTGEYHAYNFLRSADLISFVAPRVFIFIPVPEFTEEKRLELFAALHRREARPRIYSSRHANTRTGCPEEYRRAAGHKYLPRSKSQIRSANKSVCEFLLPR